MCDSLGGMNVLANHETLSEKFGEINEDFLGKLKDEALGGTKANEVSYGRQDIDFDAVAKSRKDNRSHGKASREIELGIDNSTEARYNDLYTATSDFARNVIPRDRGIFARSLANKTADMKDGEHRSFFIYGTTRNNISRLYWFEADGYMHGKITSIEVVANDTEHKRKEFKNGINSNAEIANLWVDSFSVIGRESEGDIPFDEIGREANTNDSVFADSPEFYRTTNPERSKPNYQRDAEELTEILQKLNALYKDNNKSKLSRELPGETVVEPTEKKLTNRAILANALESTAQTDAERKRLQEYKQKIEEAEALEAHLAEVNREIKEISFTEGADRSRLSELRADKAKTENRLKTYDGILLRLEATKSLKDLLDREKKAAYRKATLGFFEKIRCEA